MRARHLSLLLACALLLPGSMPLAARSAPLRPTVDIFPAEVDIGERLFTETRFAQFFAAHASNMNANLVSGDPVVETTELASGEVLTGPFHGQSMNCRACHLVEDQIKYPNAGMRTYADFTRRSPIPARSDGATRTARNSPPLVNANLPRPGGVILHFDGEFPTLKALIKGTLTGRNYGWLPGEAPQAVAHIARVIREDNGLGTLAQEFGGSYTKVLGGTDPTIPDRYVLPPYFRVDVVHATDSQILEAVARIIGAYVESLTFEVDASGANTTSPYDRFLVENGLPRLPRRGESNVAYSARLRAAALGLLDPFFIDEGQFQFHDQDRIFGRQELAGLRIFTARAPTGRPLTAEERAAGGIGNCTACHPAPVFTDFSFHDTGVTQLEYDGIHGEGAFSALAVPDLEERRLHPDEFLPATASHPSASGRFRSATSPERPGFTDLGVWNIIGNPDFPAAQQKLQRALCRPGGSDPRALPGPGIRRTANRCATEALLIRSIAAFKTPGLRDLGHSGPYLHNGQFDTLESVVGFYRGVAEKERRGELRNGAPELGGIALIETDVPALIAFLKSLNEDYH